MQKSYLTKRFILFSFYMAVHTSCFVLSYKTYIKRLRFSHSGQRSNQMFTCVHGRSHFEAYTESRKLNSYRLVTIGQSKLRSVFKQLPVKLAWDLRRLWVKLGVGNRLDRVQLCRWSLIHLLLPIPNSREWPRPSCTMGQDFKATRKVKETVMMWKLFCK